MSPVAGERILRFVGDKIRFEIRNSVKSDGNLAAFLRTNLGRATARRQEILAARARHVAAAGISWRDLPMQRDGDAWMIEIPLAEVGYFKAKPYLIDGRKWQHWPEGSDVGVTVHPDFARTGNSIYCAFTRLFGNTRRLASTVDVELEAQLTALDEKKFTVIPASGTLRDLKQQLPHIVQTLGCRILHLLPIHPTPTTYARFGRFGSPYAALDLTAIDPALVEFDKRTTGVDQFCELTYAAHSLGARVFLDIVINHTGWGSVLQENFPEFFLKNADGQFASPGAWGTTWEDLVELKQESVTLWDKIADALLIWCRRGTDGFRCDAGYKIPTTAWQYIIARVQNEFPETIFLLEGLGGSWETTETLLTEGGMQWAYSELFQNYSGKDVAWYLDYANRQNEKAGTYVHYSETHDNDRLAKKGRAWSLLRNRLCALTSPSGGFGFTCGVEWLAPEKLKVHGCTGLNWGNDNNIVPELAELNELTSTHPAFFDGAKLTRLSETDSAVYVLLRESFDGKDFVLVLANCDMDKEHSVTISKSACQAPDSLVELLNQSPPSRSFTKDKITFTVAAGAVHCLAPTAKPIGWNGKEYRRVRSQAAFAIQALNQFIPVESVDGCDWRSLAGLVERSPKAFLAATSQLRSFQGEQLTSPIAELLRVEFEEVFEQKVYPNVIDWSLGDSTRITPVPADHWLLVEDSHPFRVELRAENSNPIHLEAIPFGSSYGAAFAPRQSFAKAEIILERYAPESQKVCATIQFLSPEMPCETHHPSLDDQVLLTNGIGGMARICVDLGRINSKYDCILAANLNEEFPVDRHVFVKRLRAWVNADGFLSPLDFKNLKTFKDGPVPTWGFIANAGDGRTVEIELCAKMLPDRNVIVFQFARPTAECAHGKQLPPEADVRLTVRFDIEDRNFHCETKRNGGSDFHFASNCRRLMDQAGFEFTPAKDRRLQIHSDVGEFHVEPEWSENIPHPREAMRGQIGSGDAYSPGWFEIPLPKGGAATLVATADRQKVANQKLHLNAQDETESVEAKLLHAAKQFVVRRDTGKTIIAGYPWFLDWGRDSLICARGLIAAGMIKEVTQLALTFAKFEDNGTLPNTIHGNDVSNRDTTDAPLWFAVVCEEIAELHKNFIHTETEKKRTVLDVLESIAENYELGTSNGIYMDPVSALIWSPSHFTWMDTNFPAATPREGFPVEIQALWIRLLRLLARTGSKDKQRKWRKLAGQAVASFEELFWLKDAGYFADVLLAKRNVAAHDAVPSDALRSNCLFAVSLDVVAGPRAKRCVEMVQRYLVVPGALRSLAPLPVSIPLPIYGNDGRLLNDPSRPYWPKYEGDEDTRRKPAYHNGTAWVWTYPHFCEALVKAWGLSPQIVATAKSYLTCAEELLNEGCLGQLPEILEGNTPHQQRGCDAQAWSVTEYLRVWKWLNSLNPQAK